MRRSSEPFSFGPSAFLFLIAVQIVRPTIALASDDIAAIIVRFTQGEVTFPEDTYNSVAPLEAVTFRNQHLKFMLVQDGVRDLVEIQKAPSTMAEFLAENRLPSHERSLDEDCSSDPEGTEAQGCFS